MPNTLSLFERLKERHLFRYGALYLGAAWLVFQLAISLEEALDLPEWVDRLTLPTLVSGFPVAIVLACLLGIGVAHGWKYHR